MPERGKENGRGRKKIRSTTKRAARLSNGGKTGGDIKGKKVHPLMPGTSVSRKHFIRAQRRAGQGEINSVKT